MHYPSEYRIVLMLASIYAFRMLGLFMILPVFSLYAHMLPDATPTLIGIALGIYGLTQASLQIPLGFYSDRIGRKPVITLGLVIFAFGSIIAALSHSMMGIIIGRALQGAGAIGSSLIALIADLTQTKNRTKAMAITGIVIGISFTVAMALGPVLNMWIQVNGIFWFTALLAIIGIIILHTQIPTPTTSTYDDLSKESNALLLKNIFTHKTLVYLYLSIFILHAMMTANFVVIPLALTQTMTQSPPWFFYLPIVVGSITLTIPLLFWAEKKHHTRYTFITSVLLLSVAQLIFYYGHHSVSMIAIGMFLFFIGFNFLEAFLPSSVSKIAPVHGKGTAIGIYSTMQFLGIFFGGTAGGLLYGHYGVGSVFITGAIIACIWLGSTARMAVFKNLS